MGPSKFQVVKSDSKNAPPGVIHISGDSEVKSFCLCKCTRNTPLCDGTHRRVDLLGKPTVVQERKRKSFLKWAAAGLGAVAVGVGGFFLYRHLTKEKEQQ